MVFVSVVSSVPLPTADNTAYMFSPFNDNGDNVESNLVNDVEGRYLRPEGMQTRITNHRQPDDNSMMTITELFDKLYDKSDSVVISPSVNTNQMEPSSEKEESFGFFNTLISGTAFDNEIHQEPAFQEHQQQRGGQGLEEVGLLDILTNFKNVGAEQISGKDGVFPVGRAEKNEMTSFSPLAIDPATIQLFLKEQARTETKGITSRPPELSYAYPMSNGIVAVGNSNGENTHHISDQTDSFASTYDPDAINDQQNNFRPESSFSNFISQTGSNAANTNLPTHFDPDSLNKAYMDRVVGNVFQTPQGVNPGMIPTEMGKESSGYSFSAYPVSNYERFDASALNQALINTDHNMKPGGVPAQVELNTSSFTVDNAVRVSPRKIVSTSATTQVPKTAEIKDTTEQDNKSSPKFDFVPGNLFPGQSSTNQGQELPTQVDRSPTFLRNSPIETNSFDPNILNAAQNVFNPNSISWIRTRDLEDTFFDYNDEISNDNNTMPKPLSTMTPSHATTTIHVETTIETTTIPTTLHAVTTGLDVTDKDSNKLFNPNSVNANQGQSAFLPGQMNGYNSDSYNPNTGSSYMGVSVSQGINMGINFNIGALLGVGNSSNKSGTNQNTMFSSMIGAGNGNGPTNSNSTHSGFGIKFYGTETFNPNTANVGFGDVLKGGFGNDLQDNSTGFGMGVFDPNAANVGFGQSNFGESGNNAGFDLGEFDPNKANMMPSQQNGLSSKGYSSNTLGYYSNMLSRNMSDTTNTAYGSPYISAFNPNTVNQASFDPDVFNKGSMHFNPVDMLASNPGIDKDTLLDVAKAFDPDKENSLNAQQAFSPIQMLLSNPGVNADMLSANGYHTASNVNVTKPKDVTIANHSVGGGVSTLISDQGFDPVSLMTMLMQSASAFTPGSDGFHKLDVHPVVEQSSTTTPSTVSGTIVTSGSVSPTVSGVSDTTPSASTQSIDTTTMYIKPSIKSNDSTTTSTIVTQ